MQDAYAATVLAETPTVLGRRLAPFSLGHAHILEAVGSPFLTGEDIALGDLILAVHVCSHRAFTSDGFAVKTGPKLEKELKTWGKRNASADFVSELAVFRGYLSAHTASPKRWNKGDGGTLRVPWTLALFWSVVGGKVNEQSEMFVWNLPLPMAIAYASARSAANGDDTLVSEEEIAASAKLKEMTNGASNHTS